MIGKDIYKIYAPDGAKWTNWVRPVPFIAIDTYNRELLANWVDRKVIFLDKYETDTAIFIDLPGNESVELGISLAKIGYRPIPLFNGTDGNPNSQTIVDTYLIESSLINGSEKLKNIHLANDANPVFLLDSYRTNRYREKESIFDNSWDLYKHDIPSFEYFKQNNIKKIIVVGDTIQRDLKKIFLKFQDKGMEFYLTDGYVSPKKVILKRMIREYLEKEEL